MQIKNYPDGTSFVTIPEEWEDTHQKITFRVNSYEDLWHLIQLCEVLTYNRCKAVITIPNLLDAQADRRFSSNQSSGLYCITDVLNDFDDIEFKVFHPHNPEVVEASMCKVDIIDNFGFIEKVLNDYFHMDANPHPKDFPKEAWDDFILMSSDSGGFKPLMKLCDQLNWQGETYSASKARTKDGMKQLVDREDFNGKDILVVDDISVFGGTFKGLSKLLKERNCGKLYLAVSHMTVQDLGVDPVTNYFDRVYTTNSKFEEYHYRNNFNETVTSTPENLEIIKMF